MEQTIINNNIVVDELSRGICSTGRTIESGMDIQDRDIVSLQLSPKKASANKFGVKNYFNSREGVFRGDNQMQGVDHTSEDEYIDSRDMDISGAEEKIRRNLGSRGREYNINHRPKQINDFFGSPGVVYDRRVIAGIDENSTQEEIEAYNRGMSSAIMGTRKVDQDGTVSFLFQR